MKKLVVMPASPALAVELAPGDAASRELLDSLCKILQSAVTKHTTGIDIVASRNSRWHTVHTGSLRAWGAPHVQLGAGNYLPEIMAHYALRAAGLEHLPVHESREHMGTLDDASLTILVIDGSAGLTPRAPLALLDDGPAADEWCQKLLKGEMAQPFPLQDAGVVEPELWLELAEIQPQSVRLVAADSSLGVGRYIAEWEV